MTPSKDQYLGCLLGLAIGDALGAPYEGGPIERLVWRLIGRTKEGLPRWTDDTQMSLDLAESLLSLGELDQNALSIRFAASYHWSRGYGPSTARLLKRIRRGEQWSTASTAIYKKGSYGNGAAMRASIIALFFPRDLQTLVRETVRASEITHAHPLGVEGAILIAVATQGLLYKECVEQILEQVRTYCKQEALHKQLAVVQKWLLTNDTVTPVEVVHVLGNGITAQSSCATALYIALRHLALPFNELLLFTRACGGDVDTISAMAGTLWGAYNGAGLLPTIDVEQQARLEGAATRLYETAFRV
jgi:poly(ADP-ribose) glycohydrolase ARH3